MFLKYFLILIKTFAGGFKLELFSLFVMSVIGGFLELLGIAMIFPIVILLTSSSDEKLSPVFNNLLAFFPSLEPDKIAVILALFMVFVFLFKNFFMMYTIKAQNEFAKKWADYVNDIVVKKLLFAPYYETSKISYGDKHTLLHSSVRDISLDFILRCIILLANSVVALFIMGLLFYKFTIPALMSTAFILSFAYFENSFFKKKAKELGDIAVYKLVEFSKNINLILNSEKEIRISSKEMYFKDYLMNSSKEISSNYSKSISYGNYPLYVTEIGVILAFLVMIMSIILFDDVTKSEIISSLAIIALMVLRLVPQLNKVLISMYTINLTKQKVFWFLEKYRIISKFEYENFTKLDKLPFNSSITLKDASFEYESKRGVENINLEIKKGEFIGIIGKSGAGKTTLGDILSGLNLLKTGAMYIDDKKLDENSILSWRKNVSLLEQEPTFLNEPVLNNVAFGDENPDVNKVVESLNLAGLSNVDINSKLEMSVGQKRRVALARAYYLDPSVLILDEATSALDIESENLVVENLLKLKGQKTIIAIAHRLSTLKKCDRIIYLENGAIKDIGTFFELREKYEEIENMIKISSFE